MISRRHMPRFQGDNFEHNLKLVQKVKEIMSEREKLHTGATSRWLGFLAKGEDIVPIREQSIAIGSKRIYRRMQIVFNDGDLRRIEEPAAPGGTCCRNTLSPSGNANS